MRNRKTVTTTLGALVFILLVRTINRALNQEPLIYISRHLHGDELWKKVVQTGEDKWTKLEKRMSPDPQFQPPDDKTDGEKIYHSGNYQAIFLGPPEQPIANRRGGDVNFQKFAGHLPLESATPIPNADEYLDVGIRRSPWDPHGEDYQMAIRNTGEPHGILITRGLEKGRDPELSVSDALFYAYREFATKLVGPGYPDYRTIQNLKYVIQDRIVARETIEVLEMAYRKFNDAQHAKYEPQILVGEFRRWSYQPPRDRETVYALLGTSTMASVTSMLGNHFHELGHKCVLSLATENVDSAWYLGLLVGTEFGGECLDRDVPEVVKGDRYIQEYKEEQARKEEEARLEELAAQEKLAQEQLTHQEALAAGSEAPAAQEVLAGQESQPGLAPKAAPEVVTSQPGLAPKAAPVAMVGTLGLAPEAAPEVAGGRESQPDIAPKAAPEVVAGQQGQLGIAPKVDAEVVPGHKAQPGIAPKADAEVELVAGQEDQAGGTAPPFPRVAADQEDQADVAAHTALEGVAGQEDQAGVTAKVFPPSQEAPADSAAQTPPKLKAGQEPLADGAAQAAPEAVAGQEVSTGKAAQP